MPTLLVCPNCGGPLPPIAATAPYVTCTFCGSTSSIAEKTVLERRDGAALPPPAGERERAARDAVVDPDRRLSLWRGFLDALAAGSGSGSISYASLRDAAREHLGLFGDGDVLARITYKLALDFEREAGVAIRTADGLGRLAQGYVEAIGTLRRASSAEVSLPFLTTGPAGPVHYRRAVTAADIASMAGTDPDEPPPEKRGFLARLFG